MAETEATPLTNGVKAVADSMILPGSSLLMDGDIKNGAIHAAGGILARAVVGPVGWVAIAANSFSNSVTGKHLHEHFLKPKTSPEN